MTNRILDALPVADHERLVPTMTTVALASEAVLFEPGQPIDAVHFPLTGVVALMAPMDDGATVGVATVGTAGIVGVPLIAVSSLAVRAISAVTGTALRMEAAIFLEECEHPGPLRHLVQCYTQALFGQISQAVGCNRLHSDEQRLGRWLLVIQDGAGVDEFSVSDEFLGQMLGSSRGRARVCVENLEGAALIRDRGGRVTVVDRAGLEAVACECHGVIRELERCATGGRREA